MDVKSTKYNQKCKREAYMQAKLDLGSPIKHLHSQFVTETVHERLDWTTQGSK